MWGFKLNYENSGTKIGMGKMEVQYFRLIRCVLRNVIQLKIDLVS